MSRKPKPSGPPGFGRMTPVARRLLGSLGGRLGHDLGVTRQWTKEQAQKYAASGGQETARTHDMKAIGKLGGRPKGSGKPKALPVPKRAKKPREETNGITWNLDLLKGL